MLKASTVFKPLLMESNIFSECANLVASLKDSLESETIVSCLYEQYEQKDLCRWSPHYCSQTDLKKYKPVNSAVASFLSCR